MNNNLFRKYSNRIRREGVLKSVACGVSAGAAASVIIGLFSWLFGFKEGLFVALGAFAAVSAAVSLILYFVKFKPTVKQIARRVDELGLEERLITMVELEGDDSYIAQMQRKDTEKALSSFNSMLLKIALSASLIAVVTVAAVLGIGMTTVDSLYYAGVIDSGVAIAHKNDPVETFTLSYGIEEGEGTIYRVEDRIFQEMESADEKVEAGADGSVVYAYAARNWVFVDWSDGYQLPYRQFTAVDSDHAVSARFEPIDEPADDEPQDPGNGDGKGEGEGNDGQENGDGSPDKGNQPDNVPGGDDGLGGTGDGAGGGRDDANNQIVDGQTYYGDQYDSALEDAKGRVDSDDSLSDSQKDAIFDYLGSIEKDGQTGGSSGGQEGGGSSEGGSSESGN